MPFRHIRNAGFRVSLLAVAITTAPAWAEDAVERVEVIGQAASIDKALREQKSADSIKSVVHADGVGQLPDDNAAEALQRIPGLSVERDQGEGRFVSVRGIAPDLNSVTINGTLVPAPEGDPPRRGAGCAARRAGAVAVGGQDPDPGHGRQLLGGTIEVESLSAFDHDGLFYTLTGEANHDTNVSRDSPKFSGAVSDRFSLGDGINNFGVAAAFELAEAQVWLGQRRNRR